MLGGGVMASMEYENKYYNEGYKVIVGVDEAGRGPLAGPLVIGCVILPQDYTNHHTVPDNQKDDRACGSAPLW